MIPSQCDAVFVPFGSSDFLVSWLFCGSLRCFLCWNCLSRIRLDCLRASSDSLEENKIPIHSVERIAIAIRVESIIDNMSYVPWQWIQGISSSNISFLWTMKSIRRILPRQMIVRLSFDCCGDRYNCNARQCWSRRPWPHPWFISRQPEALTILDRELTGINGCSWNLSPLDLCQLSSEVKHRKAEEVFPWDHFWTFSKHGYLARWHE